MRDEAGWLIVHAYRKAVAKNEALAVLCPDDDSELVPVVSIDGSPAMKCFMCRSVYELGGHVYDQMLNALGLEIRET